MELIFEEYTELGYNYRMTDIQAAIGRVQLKRLPEIVTRRRELADKYSLLLSGVNELKLPDQPNWALSNWQSYCVRLQKKIDHQSVMQNMLEAGVATRRGIMCSHREKAYSQEPWSCGAERHECDCESGSCKKLLESEKAQDSSIVLPLFHQMTEKEQNTVVESLKLALFKK